jgi:4-oxalocrotonate tautomerase family enzyme
MPRITVRTTRIPDLASKRELVRRMTQATVAAYGVTPEAVTVQIFQGDRGNWAKGGQLVSDRADRPAAP